MPARGGGSWALLSGPGSGAQFENLSHFTTKTASSFTLVGLSYLHLLFLISIMNHIIIVNDTLAEISFKLQQVIIVWMIHVQQIIPYYLQIIFIDILRYHCKILAISQP